MILNLLLFISIPLSINAFQQELYKRMVFPATSAANKTIQKAETKLECASKCLFLSKNCSVFFFDLKNKSCTVTRLEQLMSSNNSLNESGDIFGYVNMGKLQFLS